jgi:dephospho-CoA kinase
MLKVGLTGGIGSGKSTVADLFSDLGIPIYNSDERAKWLLNNNGSLQAKIKSEFGDDVYEKGILKTKYLADIVFNNPAKLNQLNSFVHPEVALDFGNWLSNNSTASIVIKEAAILIESGAYKHLDEIILVTTSQENKLKRVSIRDGVSEEDVLKRMKFQIGDEEKKQYADFVIKNNSSIHDLKVHVKNLYDHFHSSLI